eukprot:1890140-Pyramimonas_sp.AAC.1
MVHHMRYAIYCAASSACSANHAVQPLLCNLGGAVNVVHPGRVRPTLCDLYEAMKVVPCMSATHVMQCVVRSLHDVIYE